MLSLWLRIGDGGEYVAHGDDLIGAIQQMIDEGVGKLLDFVPGGFTTEHFHGNNYISLYYGDQEKNFKSDLDTRERHIVELRLKSKNMYAGELHEEN